MHIGLGAKAAASRIPAQVSVDAPMMGNGFTGVAIAGKPDQQTYYLARNDFWRLKSAYNESFPAVLGKIEFAVPGLVGATYRVEQELDRAKTVSRFSLEGQTTEWVSFVGASDDVLIIRITTDGNREIEGNVRLMLPGQAELDDRFSEGQSPRYRELLDGAEYRQ